MSIFIWDVVPVQSTGAPAAIASGVKISTGTFTANGSTEVTVSDTNITASSTVEFGLNTAAGTIAGSPYMSSIVAGTSFGVKAGASDTSVYNYTIVTPGVTASEAP